MSSARVVAWLLAHRRWVMGFAFLLAIAAGWRTVRTYAALRSDLEELLPTTAPSVAALAELRSRMPGLRHLGIVIDTNGNVDAANRFVDDLAERIRGYPSDLVGAVRKDIKAERLFLETYVLQLMDASDVRKLRVAVEELRDWEVARAMDASLSDESEDPRPKLPIEELKKKYESRHGKPQTFPGDRLVSEDGTTVVLLVQASSHGTGYDSDSALIQRVRADIAALRFPEAYAPGMRVGFAGDVPTRVEEMEGLMVDLGISGVVVLVLVIAALMLFFRSWRALPILGIPLTFGTLYTFGVVALPPLAIRHLNSNTAFLGSIVVGSGINSGIILAARFAEERRGGADVQTALTTALSTTWRATLAASLAAAVSYASLITTDFRGFTQFGWIGGLGMMVTWLVNMLLIPTVASYFGERMATPRVSTRRSPGEWLSNALLARPGLVLLASTVLLVIAAGGLVKRAGDWLEYDLSKLRRRDSWEHGERYWGKRMDATLRRYLTPTVVLAHDPEQARTIEDRLRELRASDRAGGLISSLRTARDVLPPDRDAALAEARKLRELLTPKLREGMKPNERKLVDQALSDEALKPLTADRIPDVLVAGLRERDGHLDRAVLVFPKLTQGTWDATRMHAYTQDLRSVSGDAHVAGSLLLSSDIANAIRADGPRATLVSLLAVLGICAVAFRSLRLSLAAMASLFAGVTLMLGGLAWTGERLHFSNFVALPITFGIAADYSINILKRYQGEGRLRLDTALAATSGAVTLCSATTIIGFGSLLIAQNRALFSFGVFAVTGELTCLTTAVIVLPAALHLVLRRLSKEDHAPSSVDPAG
ncbi:MAG TPA: MMPL family transporter [Polyangiaceae bacterium]|nr:MMPL family transporter [Polyangiaceae bacterium]